MASGDVKEVRTDIDQDPIWDNLYRIAVTGPMEAPTHTIRAL